MKDKKRILIIEDDPVLSNNIQELLSLAGYLPTVVDNGKKGLQLVDMIAPHLVLCDIIMPDTDGLSILDFLRNKPETMHLPFIIITAKTGNDIFREAMEKGADDFLFKPFKDIELLNAIERRLRKFEEIVPQEALHLAGISSLKGNGPPLHNIFEQAEESIYIKGESIYRQDQPAEYVYFILKGAVRIYRYNYTGKIFNTDLYFKNQIFGYKAVIEDRFRQQNAEALENSRIKKLPASVFKEALINDKAFFNYIMHLISVTLSNKEQDIIHIAYDSVTFRLGKKLLELQALAPQDYLDLPRAVLAQTIGTSPETLARTVRELKDMQLIKTKGKKILIPDLQRFRYALENI
ncbi:MAG: response regulator [Bacteroidota bacterium]